MKFLFAVAIIILCWLMAAWGDMLIVGIAHRDWWPLIPLMSYHVSLALSIVPIVFMLGIGFLAGIIKEAVK